MGKKKKKEEKKGKAKDKAVLKAEKKAAQRSRKDGEEDLDAILAEIKQLDQQRTSVTETKASPPSARCYCSLVAHPERQELILFGGEFFDGQTSRCYNDLFVYNIRKDEWILWQIPNPPPPRCSHQAVAVPQGGGQMWVFGGEFVSPKAEQFHHFKDLWMLDLAHSQWDKISSSGGPSSRSGHRMVATKHFLVVFGGFHEGVRDFIYFNDVHTFSFESRTWQRLSQPAGPSARSAACLSTTPDGSVLVFGGYSKQRVKREVEKGTIHTDMWMLSPVREQSAAATAAAASKKTTATLRWKWQKLSTSGRAPPPRSGASMVQLSAQRAILFGGVEDEESDESLDSLFSSDLFQLATDGHPPRWFSVDISKSCGPVQRRRKPVKAVDEAGAEQIGDEPEEESDDEDGQSMSKASTDAAVAAATAAPASTETPVESQAPIPRMNAALAVKGSTVFVYGGMYEQGDRQVFLDDMHAVDIGRRGGWRTLVPLQSDALPWLEQDDDDEDEEEDDDDDDDDDSKKQGQAAALAASSSEEEEEDDEEVDQPATEKFGQYFIRTKEDWIELARKKLADKAHTTGSCGATKGDSDEDDDEEDEEVSVRKLAFQLAETHFRTLQQK